MFGSYTIHFRNNFSSAQLIVHPMNVHLLLHKKLLHIKVMGILYCCLVKWSFDLYSIFVLAIASSFQNESWLFEHDKLYFVVTILQIEIGTMTDSQATGQVSAVRSEVDVISQTSKYGCVWPIYSNSWRYNNLCNDHSTTKKMHQYKYSRWSYRKSRPLIGWATSD